MQRPLRPGERRHFLDFASAAGVIPEATLLGFRAITASLAAPIPIAVLSALLECDHDFSDGSDHLILVESLIHKTAAEVWAAERILSGELGRLTMFHHARALYEGHALSHWMFTDFARNWQRVEKEVLWERDTLEKSCLDSIGPIPTDITEIGRRLLDDPRVLRPPSVFDQAKTKPILRYDYASFWKYSSAHVHPAHIGGARVTHELERITIDQIIGAVVRHAAGTYREIVDQFRLQGAALESLLSESEEYGKYPFDIPNLGQAEP